MTFLLLYIIIIKERRKKNKLYVEQRADEDGVLNFDSLKDFFNHSKIGDYAYVPIGIMEYPVRSRVAVIDMARIHVQKKAKYFRVLVQRIF